MEGSRSARNNCGVGGIPSWAAAWLSGPSAPSNEDLQSQNKKLQLESNGLRAELHLLQHNRKLQAEDIVQLRSECQDLQAKNSRFQEDAKSAKKILSQVLARTGTDSENSTKVPSVASSDDEFDKAPEAPVLWGGLRCRIAITTFPSILLHLNGLQSAIHQGFPMAEGSMERRQI